MKLLWRSRWSDRPLSRLTQLTACLLDNIRFFVANICLRLHHSWRLTRKQVMRFEYDSKFISARQAAGMIKDRDLVILSNGVCAPFEFIKALAERAPELEGVRMNHAKITSHEPLPYANPELSRHLIYDTFGFAIEFKKTMMAGAADMISCGYRDIACFIDDGTFKPDVTVLQLTEPDAAGFCSYGLTASYLPSAIRHSKLVIAEVNSQLPRTGGARVHVDDIDYFIGVDYRLPQAAPDNFGDIEKRIGTYIASLVEDGSTLQLGIGAIPNAALAMLSTHKDLGIHSETFGDTVIDLVKKGVINGRCKTFNKGLLTATFITGSDLTYDFCRENGMMVDVQCVSYTNDPAIIARQDNMIAINSAVEVDITGQINAESLGSIQISFPGGQMEFAMGALHSKGGKYIVAMPSTAAKGSASRITPYLTRGASVSVPRHQADFIITEYGIAALRGKNNKQRARALIEIAHPDFREQIEREATERMDIHL